MLRSWPLLLLLVLFGLSGCAGPGAAPSADACAAAASQLGRQMGGSGVALPGMGPRQPELIAALRLANLHLLLSQEAASQLFECRSTQARAVREDQAAGRIGSLRAELRVARIRSALRDETEAAIAVSERIGIADAALVAAASAHEVSSTAAEGRQASELRRLVATNTTRRESFGAMVMLAGRLTDIEMDRDVASR